MAQFEWTFDAPTGTYKNHSFTEKLFEAALEKSAFMEHVMLRLALGKRSGETQNVVRISNLTEPTNARLSETDRIPEDELSITTKGITVTEWGRSVPFTGMSEDLSKVDMGNVVQKRLRDQLQLVLDTAAAAAYKLSKIKYAVTGAATNNITTNGVFGAASTANMGIWHVEEIRDYMFDTLHVPTIDGDYVGIFRTLGLRGIKRDSDFEEWLKYTDPSRKFNSEVGRWDQIRFIETNHANAMGKVGTSSVLGEGVVFGEDAVAYVEAQTPELRVMIPRDYGRAKGVAWYGIMELDLIWDTGNAGEARIVHVGST